MNCLQLCLFKLLKAHRFCNRHMKEQFVSHLQTFILGCTICDYCLWSGKERVEGKFFKLGHKIILHHFNSSLNEQIQEVYSSIYLLNTSVCDMKTINTFPWPFLLIMFWRFYEAIFWTILHKFSKNKIIHAPPIIDHNLLLQSLNNFFKTRMFKTTI